MFIINLTYKVELKTIELFLDDHIEFLTEQYKNDNFIASGRKVPRTGGIILSNIDSKSDLEKVIQGDPFYENKLADYEIIEFIPSKTSRELNFLKK